MNSNKDISASQQPSASGPPEWSYEYAALRAEIVARLTSRHRILTYTIVVLGILFTVAVGKDELMIEALLIYPLIATFFAMGWSHDDLRIQEIGNYIRDHIETKSDYVSWETHIFKQRVSETRPLFIGRSEFYAMGIFLGTELLSIALALLKFDWSSEALKEMPAVGLVTGGVLLLLDLLAACFTIKSIRRRRMERRVVSN